MEGIKYNILVVNPNINSRSEESIGGLTTFMESYVKGMTKRGHHVFVFSPHYRYVKEDNLTCVHLKMDNPCPNSNIYSLVISPEKLTALIGFSKGVANYIRDKQLDKCDLPCIVQLTDGFCGPIANEIKKRRDEGTIQNVKVVGTIHNGLYNWEIPLTPKVNKIIGPDFTLRNKDNLSLLETLVDCSDVVTTVGETYCERFSNYHWSLIPSGKRLIPIPNGVDIHLESSPKLEDRFSFEPNSTKIPMLLYASRPTHEKGIAAMLNALPELIKKYRVHFAGEMPADISQAIWLNQMIQNNPERVKHLGELTPISLHRTMKEATAILNPTMFAPFELIGIEGVLNGAVFVGTRVGSQTDNFKDVDAGGNAIFIDCKDYIPSWNNITRINELSFNIIQGTNRLYYMLQTTEGVKQLQRGIDQTIELYREEKLWSMKECLNGYENLYDQMVLQK